MTPEERQALERKIEGLSRRSAQKAGSVTADLDLRRKYWEAVNPRIEKYYSERESLGPDFIRETLERLPAIESDPGIALAELVRVCGERLYWWNVGTGYVDREHKYFYCNIGLSKHGNAYTLSNLEGATVAEAITRALTEALRK